MSVQGRTWALWAYRYENGDLWHIGERSWVQLHGLSDPLVAVLVEEVLGDPYDPRVTHYGWQDVKDPADDAPVMIQIRTGSTPQRAMMFLSSRRGARHCTSHYGAPGHSDARPCNLLTSSKDL
jgi:hypothetical protein